MGVDQRVSDEIYTMETTTNNGKPTTASELLESLSKVIEKLEREVQRQDAEIRTLRNDRDWARFMVDEYKRFIREIPEWENLTEKDFPYTSSDIMADIDSM
jgi:YesN/AraC family two-component response regulator